MLRAIYVASGCKDCHSCGKPKEGPCEMYEYIDPAGERLIVCFECRMHCTPERTAQSFRDRGAGPLS